MYVKFHTINTPNTLEEFRENLRKYFMGFGEHALYVKSSATPATGIPYDQLSSLDDLYGLVSGYDPQIIPLIQYRESDVRDFMVRNSKTLDSDGFFHDDFPVVEKRKFSDLGSVQGLQWVGIDNQILREFYCRVLGEFSGYSIQEEV